ncbi:hypothetical protein F5Y16DRAFT_94490 [Xylariaceae sp. FL0255]|nr:hypothetical protein F5Y16DRAFT_94490 [Xylariaceae sp. FL0255]
MPEDVEANGTEASDIMSDNDMEPDEIESNAKGDDSKMMDQHTSPETGTDNATEPKKKYDPKDPHRPRRKKARRACFACQRAHLTCGDERPCTRCIKRGLADGCQDGVRKKAKYLHDAPPEALGPVLGPNYNSNVASKPTINRQISNGSTEASAYYPQNAPAPAYPIYANGQTSATGLTDNMSFGGQPSPVTPGFQAANHPRQMNGMVVPQVSAEMANNFPPAALFDPSNPAIFNFDLEGLNFGSQYGALEFGMLNHMSSGAAETPPREALANTGDENVGYNQQPMFAGTNQYGPLYDQAMVDNFMNIDQNNAYSQGNLQHGLPHAYAIAAAGPTPNSLNSPGTDNTSSPQPTTYGYENSPTVSTFTNSSSQPLPHPPRPKAKANVGSTKFGPQSIASKRRDPSAIYDTVKEPYPYLAGFHNLIALIQRRFPPNKTMRIAKSLASVRPSFMAVTRNLNTQDLIFMEKCLQRTLFEVEDFLGHTPSPSIVCRRTGEVVAVNKEFVALTGWTKDILLGKEPNLNVNLGRSGSESGSLNGKTELTTPRLVNAQPDLAKKLEGMVPSVFVAEFMDDDSVVQFYEDFAQLAFGNSRGSIQRRSKLLKYRTKEMNEALPAEESPRKTAGNSILSNRVTKIDGELGISRLGKDGKIDCTYTCVIKRDMFDIPMLIVMNVRHPFWPCCLHTLY